MKADELWEKYSNYEGRPNRRMPKAGFFAALAEYGAAVRAEDVNIVGRIADSECYNIDERTAAKCCAAAIENTPLP